ncbi:hypothetical protein O181_055429 [Austropuccinia psidii MF-1]|uniref:Uncharacterized protein n=1 Tax=Austropuccinia psidii MF-1 TaxID=1389203 RepID=A0A9Q3E6G4_9BASI|nr:hypothetical protein [Austropuccinia psidii MF-1]
MVHSLPSVGQLAPFWPNPMRPKGGNPLAPKARWVPNHNWAHLSQIWPQMTINHHRIQFGPGSPWTIFQPMTPGTHQRPPGLLSSILLLILRGILRFLHAPHTQGCRSGA